MTSSLDRNWVKVLPDAERSRFDALKVPDDVRQDYEERKKERLASLFLDAQAARPQVRQLTAYLDREVWIPFEPAE